MRFHIHMWRHWETYEIALTLSTFRRVQVRQRRSCVWCEILDDQLILAFESDLKPRQ